MIFFTALFISLPSVSANVRFLALGNPSSIRIQGEAKTIKVEKSSWKEGNFSGVFHVPLDEFETGISLRDRHMKEKYLETAKYPNADLELQNCPLKEGVVVCEGKLTLHGTTKPISIQFTGKAKEKNLTLHASFSVKLSNYGISVPTFARITVAEEVQVEIDSETVQF